MRGELDGTCERLQAVVDELDELISARLHEAAENLSAGARPGALAEERRLTRARRSVEKALYLLRPPEAD